MVAGDKTRFQQAFNRLAVAVRLPAEQADAAMQRVFWDGLQRLPIDAVEAAAVTLAESAVWFPKLAEWRDAAEGARNKAALARALPGERQWHVECPTCDDTGWEILACPGEPASCGRDRPHAAHGFAVPCACRPGNQTYQRRVVYTREQARGRKGERHG